MAYGVVYKILNTINGHFYIGITTKDIKYRLRMHFNEARSGTTYPLHRAIRKYGEEHFFIKSLYSCSTKEELKSTEKDYISVLKPYYNATKGGDGVFGYKFPREIVERIANSKRGKPGYWRGKNRSAETIEKIRKATLGRVGYWTGKKRDLATIEKIRKSKVGKPNPWMGTQLQHEKALKKLLAAAERRKKKCMCLSDGRHFNSAKEASLYYNISSSDISRVALGKRASAGSRKFPGGLKFKYMET
ncbi:MAG: NUMOD3 domain-containing DNA-binding protein [Patescibacteria group bacterium]|mgnify:FL=1